MRRHDYPDAKVETERGVPHSLRRRREFVASLKLSAEARERRDRKRRLDSESAEEKDTRLSCETQTAYSHHSCIVLTLHKMSLATFHIELGLHSICMFRLHALYLMLRFSYCMCMYLR